MTGNQTALRLARAPLGQIEPGRRTASPTIIQIFYACWLYINACETPYFPGNVFSQRADNRIGESMSIGHDSGPYFM